MGFKLSNPVKSIGGSIGRIIKKPGDTSAWKDLAVGGATGGWYQTEAVDEQQAKEKARKDAINAQRSLTAGKQEGYDEARGWYGQGQEEIGPQTKEVGGMLRDRALQSGGDPVSAAIASGAANARANAQRTAAQQGMKGGAAMGAIDAASRAKEAEVRASLYGQQGAALDDYRDYLGNVISGSKDLAYDTAALNQKTPTPPKQRSWMSDLTGGLV